MRVSPVAADERALFSSVLADVFDGAYALVIDARSGREYAEDHLPGAINLPVVDDKQYSEVGTVHRTDRHRAYTIGVSYALRNISHAIDDLVARYPKEARMLVYCFRGGKRSKLWFDALSTIGYQVDRLPGGWKAYRAWVREELERLPGTLRYHVLGGPTGCGKTRLLSALADVGAQVLDLEDLARHRGSLIGAIPGVAQPSQKWFDSLLLDKLRRFDPSKPVWIEAESKKIGAIEIPIALLQSMRSSPLFSVKAPMSQRVALWREDYSHFERDPRAMLERLRHLRPLVGGEEFGQWERLAGERHVDNLFQRLMEVHYDPAYSRSLLKNYPQFEGSVPVELDRLDHPTLVGVARTLHSTAVTT
jgi:tRNA 2-selenouridine synthase